MASKDEAQEILAKEILDDGRRRAERILADARAEADKLLAEADARAAAEAAKIVSDGQGLANKRTQMIMSSVVQETAQRKLRAREEAVQQILGEARAGLEKLDGPAYRNALLSLSTEALRRMPGESFVARVTGINESECATLRDTLLATMRAEGRPLAIQCIPVAQGPRGVIVESADGRLRWDNTFEARLNRMRAGLRRVIAPVLFGKL